MKTMQRKLDINVIYIWSTKAMPPYRKPYDVHPLVNHRYGGAVWYNTPISYASYGTWLEKTRAFSLYSKNPPIYFRYSEDKTMCLYNYRMQEYRVPYAAITGIAHSGVPDAVLAEIVNWIKMIQHPD